MLHCRFWQKLGKAQHFSLKTCAHSSQTYIKAAVFQCTISLYVHSRALETKSLDEQGIGRALMEGIVAVRLAVMTFTLVKMKMSVSLL